MRRFLPTLLLLAGCTGPGPADPGPDDSGGSDSSDSDTATVDSRPDPRDSDDTDTDTDTGVPPVDTDEPLPPSCSVDLPAGPCPPGSTCRADGRCLLELDPGDPPDGLGAAWSAYVAWARPRELAEAHLPVTWTGLEATVASGLASASTAYEAAWRMTEGVGTLRQGHTWLQVDALCDVDPGLSSRRSDAGACVVEDEGQLVVYAAEAGTPWRVGDVLVALDGRPAAALVADRLAQPRCALTAPSEAARRAEAVASLLLRGSASGDVVVRGVDGRRRTFTRPLRPPVLDCDGRIPPAGEVDLGGNVLRTDLPGGVVLVRLPRLGGSSGPPGPEASVAALRGLVQGLPSGTPVIVDLRSVQGGYPGVVDALAGWALPDGSPLRTCTDRVAPGEGGTVGPSTLPSVAEDGVVLDGPLAVLTDHATYGAPEYLPLAWRDRALLVGHPGYGSYGLSGGYRATGLRGAVDARRCDDAQGLPLEGRPPPLDLEVGLHRADVAQGVDTVIEAARRALLSP
ncbi:MAG: hypothetical protein H6732_13095 [Alphaproteobacteria bacterium]|nr:hypothetical protein [Alphaproteobacteria bacterium]